VPQGALDGLEMGDLAAHVIDPRGRQRADVAALA
jgi:hypothetical protein